MPVYAVLISHRAHSLIVYFGARKCAMYSAIKNEPHGEKTGFLPMPKFQASNHLLFVLRPVCLRPGRNPEDLFSHVAAQKLHFPLDFLAIQNFNCMESNFCIH